MVYAREPFGSRFSACAPIMIANSLLLALDDQGRFHLEGLPAERRRQNHETREPQATVEGVGQLALQLRFLWASSLRAMMIRRPRMQAASIEETLALSAASLQGELGGCAR